jgi:antitoxin CcdA
MRMEIRMDATPSPEAARRGRSRPRAGTSPASASPAKRATNLSLSSDVLDAARALQINVSQVCDQHLRDVVRREQERRWRAEHADFIAAHNDTLAREGLPLDEWKTF